MQPWGGAGRGVQAGAGREETPARPSAFDLPKILLGTVRRRWRQIWPDRSRLVRSDPCPRSAHASQIAVSDQLH
jgi:hypothetical protein